MKNILLLISYTIVILLFMGFAYQTQGVQGNTPTATNTVKPTSTPSSVSTPNPSPTSTLMIITTAIPATVPPQTSQISVDWTIPIIAFSSLIISIITLYLAHLRGSDINLALPDKIYPCHGISTAKNEETEHFVLHSNLLIANTGMRSGVLYSFRVDPSDSAVGYYELDPQPENTLPQTIPAGGGWQTRISVQIKTDTNSLGELLENKTTLNMRVVYRVNANFIRRRIEKKAELNIDLRPLHATISS